MSPAPGGELEEPRNGRRRRFRRHARLRRRRALLAVLAATGLLVLAGIAAASYTAVAAFRASCDVSTLRPVAIGENSFVYAADGSLLGAIPAERNRQPVSLDAISP